MGPDRGSQGAIDPIVWAKPPDLHYRAPKPRFGRNIILWRPLWRSSDLTKSMTTSRQVDRHQSPIYKLRWLQASSAAKKIERIRD